MKIVVFSGAGTSQESGLDTFRKGGMWDGRSVHEVASYSSWNAGDESRQIMLDFYNQRRRECHAAQPNPSHFLIAEWQARGHEVTVITQNVDNLYERAGVANIIHLHGELMKARPEDRSPGLPDSDASIIEWTDDLNLGDLDPRGIQLRPHIVWFGESLPEFDAAYRAATDATVDVLVVVGTTLEVGPANLCAFDCQARVAYMIDPDPPVASWHPNLTVLKTTAGEGMRIVDQLIG